MSAERADPLRRDRDRGERKQRIDHDPFALNSTHNQGPLCYSIEAAKSASRASTGRNRQEHT